MKKSTLIALAAIVTFGGAARSSFAANYGMAGCGLGALVLKDTPGKVQIVASILNYWFGQPFSITTGTSNCTPDARSASAMFITINEVAVKKDISRGEGETLLELAQMYNCEAAIGPVLKNNYDAIFTSTEVAPAEIDANIKSVLKTGASCNI